MKLAFPTPLLIGLNLLYYVTYIVLFGVSIYVLSSRRNAAYQWHLLSTVVLFSCITLHIAVGLYIVVTLVDDNQLCDAAVWIHRLTNLVAHFIADSVLIGRCYIIWDRRKDIVALPIILLLGSTVLGALAAARWASMEAGQAFELTRFLSQDPDAKFILASFYVSLLLTNLLVTGLSAGRIWYIATRASGFLGSAVQSRYQWTISLIIESGLIYSITLLVFLGLYFSSVYVRPSVDWLNYARDGVLPLVVQTSGITPTLLIVRVGLRPSIKHVVNSCQPSGSLTERIELSFVDMQYTSGTATEQDDTSSVLDICHTKKGQSA